MSPRETDIANPWQQLLVKIELATENIRKVYVLAFSEGIVKLDIKNPAAMLQVDLFENLWERWSDVKLTDYISFADFEKKLEELSSGLKRQIASFERNSEVQVIAKDLPYAISPEKKELLYDIFAYYRQMLRIKYIVMLLSIQMSPDKCQDEMNFLKQISTVNKGQLQNISDNLTTYQHRFVNPLIIFNNVLLAIMKEKNYSDLIVDELRTLEQQELEDQAFLPLLTRLNELPADEILQALINKQNPPPANTLTLNEYSEKIQQERMFLRGFMDVILDESDKQIKQFAGHHNSLLQIRNKAKSLEEIKGLFACLRKLKELYESATLVNGADGLIANNKKFSAALIANSYNAANDVIKQNTTDILKSIVESVGLYAVPYEIFHASVDEFDSTDRQLRDTAIFINEWSTVNAQCNTIVDHAVQILGEYALKTKELSTNTLDDVISHIKYHFIEYIVSPIAGLGAGVFFACMFFMATIAIMAPVFVGVGLLVGIGIGVLTSFLRDEMSPPPKPPAPEIPAIMRLNKDEIEKAREQLFGTEDNPTVRNDITEPDGSVANNNAAEPAARANNPIGVLFDLIPKPTLTDIKALPGISQIADLPFNFWFNSTIKTQPESHPAPGPRDSSQP